jgi:hypothetical protein
MQYDFPASGGIFCRCGERRRSLGAILRNGFAYLSVVWYNIKNYAMSPMAVSVHTAPECHADQAAK